MNTSKFNLSRRTFVKTALAVSAAAGVSAIPATPALAEASKTSSAEVKRIRTACRGCGKMECGLWVTVSNGRVVKIEGDESAITSNGNCCTKSQASVQAAYHPDRLRYPMRRTTPRGEDPQWQRISWDEAYDLIYDNFMELYNQQGADRPSAKWAARPASGGLTMAPWATSWAA